MRSTPQPPQGGMWRATFGGVNRYPNNSANRADALGARALSGVARRRRTLIAPVQIASLRGKAAWLGRTTESHGPTDVLRPCGYEGPDSGGCGRTLPPATGYPTTSGLAGGVVNASSILNARCGSGRFPAHASGPDGARAGAMRHRRRWRAGAGAGAHVHRPQWPMGWNLGGA